MNESGFSWQRSTNSLLRGDARSLGTVIAAIAAIVTCLGAGAEIASAAPVFPLKASANGHYLVDQNNVPFRIQGDSPWELIHAVTATDADTYLANRAAKGFNTLLMELVERKSRAGSPAPADKNGDLPFLKQLGGSAYTGATVLADLSTPNDAYFAYVDTVLAKIAAQNMAMLITPLYVGYGGDTTPGVNNEGWSAEMNANSSASCYAYGQYVGDRYRNQKNIIWVEGGDWTLQPPTPTAMRTCMLQVMQGIKDGKGNGGSSVLQTAHWVRGQMSTDDAGFAPQMNVNSVYPFPTSVASMCRTAYGRSPVLPAYVIEAYYEGEHSMTRDGLRQENYYAVLECIGGYVFGNAPLWLFDVGWQTAMDAAGSLDTQRAGALLNALAWQNLVPSNLGTLAGTLLVTGGADIAAGGDVAAAASSTALVAYLPSTGTGTRAVTVNMAVLGGPGRARWYNPTNGIFTDITGGAYTLPNSGTQSFTSPGNNGTGTNDWVLVLDTASGALAPPTNLRVTP
jgi:Protein of unknown function (DUF4038)/Putative collagen-binding domain of a collagenase